MSSQLTKSLDFPEATIINGDIPEEPVAADATILPLGGNPTAKPGGADIMALEVTDEEGRTPAATLMQFGDDDSHVRVPVPDGQSGGVIENPFTGGDDLCEGLCDTLYAVTVYVAVEFTSGEVSPVTQQTIILDCTEDGDPNACGGDVPEVGVIEGLACGSLADGELVLTGIDSLDRYFDAVAQVERSSEYGSASLEEALALVADALGLPTDSDADAIKTELEDVIAASTESGLTATVGERGCAVQSTRVSSTLQSCDPDADAGTSMECLGDCRPTDGDAECPSGTVAGCRGIVEAADCGGSCIGACTETLDMPAACAGTCSGMCSGACPDDGMGGCEGPCVGDCTGECRSLSADTCDGTCNGLCSETTDAACAEPKRRLCSASGDPAECAGDCFGEPSVPDTIAVCELNATAFGRLLPSCEQPLVQLSFSFPAGLDESEQADFASKTEALTPALSLLLDALARVDMVTGAGNDLQSAAMGIAGDALDDALADMPDGTDPACAEEAMADVDGVITDALSSLSDAAQAAQSVLDPIAISP